MFYKMKCFKMEKIYSRLICKNVQCSLFIWGFILYIFENYNLWEKNEWDISKQVFSFFFKNIYPKFIHFP